ncbi:Meiotically up-regulated protein 190 [Ceratocystis lukuohia]|uniref:Meiotically up-regulated protein 190 n=1 Tax=Ceratocystis lukuohia TaxID=2019550 RepID=A0ABR4MD76_9PEZI
MEATKRLPASQPYSGRNRIPNISEFMQRLDQNKGQRDAEIDNSDQRITPSKPKRTILSSFTQNPNAVQAPEDDDVSVEVPVDGEAHDHVPVKRKKKGWRTVRDPVTGKDVQIQDIDMDYKTVVDDPKLSVPNENLGRPTTVPMSSSMSGEEYRHAQDITAPPDPIELGSTSDVPIRSEKTSILFYKTPSISYEPMFELLEMRASFLAVGLFFGISIVGSMFGGRIWAMTLLGAFVASAVFLWVKDLIRSGRDREWESERERGEMATANLIPESAEWMNSMLGLFWGLINPEMFAGVADTIEDIMVASVPGIIENVRVADISQGSNPIRVLSLRSLPDNHMQDIKSELHNQNVKSMDPEELAAMEQSGAFYNLEASVAYHAKPSGGDVSSKAKNMGMRLVFYLGIRGLFGVPLPVWVELIGLVATVRMRVQLTPEPPFLKTLTITLMGVPKVQAGCTPMIERGVNILNLPLISNFVNWAIKTAASMYVAPKSLTLDIASMLSGDDIVRDTTAIGVIYIRIRRGIDLSKQDHRGSPGGGSDPYVTVSWSKFSKPLFCTRVIQDYLNPIFEESCGLLVTPDTINADERISLELWDSDRNSADDIVGKIELSIERLMANPNQMFEQTSSLKGLKAESSMPGQLLWDVGYFQKAPFRESLRLAAEKDMERERQEKKKQLEKIEEEEKNIQEQKGEDQTSGHLAKAAQGHQRHDSKMADMPQSPANAHHPQPQLGDGIVQSANGRAGMGSGHTLPAVGEVDSQQPFQPLVEIPTSNTVAASHIVDSRGIPSPLGVSNAPNSATHSARTLNSSSPGLDSAGPSPGVEMNSASATKPASIPHQAVKADRKAEIAATTSEDEKHAILTPPDPQWPSGILSIVVHQIVGLELVNIKGSAGKRKGREYEPGRPEAGAIKEEQGRSLPSSYCTILVNDELIYKTRTKAVSSQPIFNAGTEQFIRDWTSCIATVTVRDSRNREHDPILGVVPLKIAEILHNSSQITRWYPIDGGIGFGRVRISLLFRSVQLNLPPTLRGWDVGTFEFTSGKMTATSYISKHRPKLRLRTGGSSVAVGREMCTVLDDKGTVEWDISTHGKHDHAVLPGLRLPVRYRYRSPIFIEFWQPRKHSPDAFASMWLQDIADLEENSFDIPIWKCDNQTRLSQNYITEQNLKDVRDLDLEEVGRLRFSGRFSAGTDRDHIRFVTSDTLRETIETWEACYAEGVRSESVDVAIPESAQKLHKAAEHEEEKKLRNSMRSSFSHRQEDSEAIPEEKGSDDGGNNNGKNPWIAHDGTDWSRAFGEDPSQLMAGPRARSSMAMSEGVSSLSSHGYSEPYTRSSISGPHNDVVQAEDNMIGVVDTQHVGNSQSADNTAVVDHAGDGFSQQQSLGVSTNASSSRMPLQSRASLASHDSNDRQRLSSPNQGVRATAEGDSDKESKNPLKLIKSYKSRSRDLHRVERGLMQWKPMRNIRFAKDEAIYAARRVKNLGSLNGRTPDVETEISNNK